MFAPTKIAAAILSLMPLTTVLGQCSRLDTVCLTSFRWCDSSPCDFPPGVYPQHGDLDRNVGYAMLTEHGEYDITWENAPPDGVEIRWTLASGPVGQPHPVWSKNITGNHYKFKPREAYRDILASGDFSNITFNDLRVRASNILNRITIVDHTSAEEPLYASSSQFNVQADWAAQAADAQGEIARREERKAWRMGVGMGVGLGVPVMMAVSALGTWLFMKKRLRKREAPVVKPTTVP